MQTRCPVQLFGGAGAIRGGAGVGGSCRGQLAFDLPTPCFPVLVLVSVGLANRGRIGQSWTEATRCKVA
jgi:hypothetical protein